MTERERAVRVILSTCAPGDSSMRHLAETIAASVDRALGGSGVDFEAAWASIDGAAHAARLQEVP